MKEIKSIYIIDAKGNPFFIRDIFSQGMGDSDHMLLTNFINAIQSFAAELGGGEAKVIKFGDSKIFSTKDPMTNIMFVIKAILKSKDKKLLNLLNQIKNLFIEKFTGNLTADSTTKIRILEDFRDALDELIKPKDNVDAFLTSI
ncbi:MAG: hypothetical protein ACTSR8_11395 [Promethearchaeota archaeon]